MIIIKFLIIPSLAIFLGLGALFLLNPAKEIVSKYKTIPIYLFRFYLCSLLVGCGERFL